MKQCPQCNRTYADNSLTYCLADGSLLSAPYDPETTQRIQAPRITNPVTEVLPSNTLPPPAAAGPHRNPLPTYIIIALLALLVGGGAVALIKSGNTDTRTAQTPSPSPSNISNISSATPTVSPPERNSDVVTTPTPAKSGPASSTTTKPLPPPSSGTWFVILGSFPKSDYASANQRLQYVRGSGYDASIIDTDNYPGLRAGLWAVVMGPYSKSYATTLVTQMKAVRSDAYIKSGW